MSKKTPIYAKLWIDDLGSYEIGTQEEFDWYLEDGQLEDSPGFGRVDNLDLLEQYLKAEKEYIKAKRALGNSLVSVSYEDIERENSDD